MLGLRGRLDSPWCPVRLLAADLRLPPSDHGHPLSSPAFGTQDPPPTCQSRLESDWLPSTVLPLVGSGCVPESGFRRQREVARKRGTVWRIAGAGVTVFGWRVKGLCAASCRHGVHSGWESLQQAPRAVSGAVPTRISLA